MSDELVATGGAVQELEAAAREFAEAVGRSGPIQEFVAWITDEIRYRREPRKAKLLLRAAESIRTSGLPVSAVNDRLLRTVLEEGALEDDEDMQDRWANLLANAATGMSIPPSFPEILRQLEPVEARLLETIGTLLGQARLRGHAELLPHDLPVDDPALSWRHLDNLERLNLIQYVSDSLQQF